MLETNNTHNIPVMRVNNNDINVILPMLSHCLYAFSVGLSLIGRLSFYVKFMCNGQDFEANAINRTGLKGMSVISSISY